MQPFELFVLPVGGGELALSPMIGRVDYAADLKIVRDWGPVRVLSMVELAELRGSTLGGDLGPGIWRHFPVVDYQVPTQAQGAAWNELQSQILADLATGGRVLVHCMGGCGRSGMAVLRLMIAAGDAPDTALKRLRRVRPCAVETEAQMAWAISGPFSSLPL